MIERKRKRVGRFYETRKKKIMKYPFYLHFSFFISVFKIKIQRNLSNTTRIPNSYLNHSSSASFAIFFFFFSISISIYFKPKRKWRRSSWKWIWVISRDSLSLKSDWSISFFLSLSYSQRFTKLNEVIKWTWKRKWKRRQTHRHTNRHTQ